MAAYPVPEGLTCPTESTEVFRCRGTVYVGCKLMCPDFALTPNSRWAQAWRELWGWGDEPIDDLIHDLEQSQAWRELWQPVDDLKKDPRCLGHCKNAMSVMPLLAVVCAGSNFSKYVLFHPVLARSSALIASVCDNEVMLRYLQSWVGLSASWVVTDQKEDWCKQWCASPPGSAPP